MERYPATLLLYSLGLGAVSGNKIGLLKSLLMTKIAQKAGDDIEAVQILPPFSIYGGTGDDMRVLEGMKDHRAPLNEWMFQALRPHASRVIPHEDEFMVCFDKLEILIALCGGNIGGLFGDYYGPIGIYCALFDRRNRVIREIQESINSERDQSMFVESASWGKIRRIAWRT